MHEAVARALAGVVPEAPGGRLRLGERLPAPLPDQPRRKTGETVLAWLDQAGPRGDEVVVLTDVALYATGLPQGRKALSAIRSVTVVPHRTGAWWYVDDWLAASLPELAPLAWLGRAVLALRGAHEEGESRELELKPTAGDTATLGWQRLTQFEQAADLVAGKYRLLRELGKGAYGEVSLARDVRLDKVVALKRLKPAMAQEAQTLARFVQEARALSQLSSPLIAEVYALELHAGDYWLVMEYLPGGSLADVLTQRGRLPWPEAVAILTDVVQGLAAAHGRGIVHRDLKPGNLLFGPEGRVKLTDFGVAHVPPAAGGVELTSSGVPVGTVLYMAPEQVLGSLVDGRCDLYAAGAVLFRLVAGRTYLEEARCRSMHAALDEVLRGVVPRLEDLVPETPPALARLVQRLLAKNPDDRPASAGDVLALLRKLGPEPEAPEARPAPSPEPQLAAALAKYRRLVGLLLTDGVLVRREREVLAEQARRLGLAPAAAAACEEDVLAATALPYRQHDVLEFEEMAELFLVDGVLHEAEQQALREKAAAAGFPAPVVELVLEIVRQQR